MIEIIFCNELGKYILLIDNERELGLITDRFEQAEHWKNSLEILVNNQSN